MSGTWPPPPGAPTPEDEAAPGWPTQGADPTGLAPPGWQQPGGQQPGGQQPGWQQPGWVAPPVVGWTGATGPGGLALGAAHRPGAVPLRPLGLSDIFDGAFRIIRFNPRATVGAAVLVSSLSWVVPLIVTAILAGSTKLSLSGDGGSSSVDVAGVVAIASFGVGLLLSSIAGRLVTGLVAYVTLQAALGRRVSLGEAWRGIRGKRWRLIALPLLIGLVGLLLYAVVLAVIIGTALATHSVALTLLVGFVCGVLFVVGAVWLWVRFTTVAVPALVLEPLGVWGALRRSGRLSRGQFWRLFGISLLAVVVAAVGGSVLRFVPNILGNVAIVAVPDHSLPILAVTTAIGVVLSSAFLTPFLAAVSSLQYLDQRMRKEAFDVTLMEQAGITAS